VNRGAALPSHRNRWSITADNGPIDLREIAATTPDALSALMEKTRYE
jgi:hypothetical protein